MQQVLLAADLTSACVNTASLVTLFLHLIQFTSFPELPTNHFRVSFRAHMYSTTRVRFVWRFRVTLFWRATKFERFRVGARRPRLRAFFVAHARLFVWRPCGIARFGELSCSCVVATLRANRERLAAEFENLRFETILNRDNRLRELNAKTRCNARQADRIR